jgi:hypothetical protein
VAQGIGPEFKPQNWQKKKKMSNAFMGGKNQTEFTK